MSDSQDVPIVYGTTWCPDCRRAKQFLGEMRIPYRWVDVDKNPQAIDYVLKMNEGRRIIPTILFPDGTVLVEPSNAELAEHLGLTIHATRTFYDIVIVGAGAAGLTAAIYTAREGLDTLVIERGSPGGQAAVTQIIDNYPGFDEGISGEEFARRLVKQAHRFGVEVLLAQEVTGIRAAGRHREVTTSDGHCYAGRAVLLATGARYRRLDIPGEDALIGINVHFCATCDGAFYRGKNVLVIGGGNSAFEESLFLTRHARKVMIAIRSEPSASSILQEKVSGIENVDVITHRVADEFVIDGGALAGVRMRDPRTGEKETWHPDGVFVFIGMEPNSEFLPDEIERDEWGFVLTDATHQTSVRGVFAAGDIRAGATAQLASAAGEGATAALLMREYLQNVP